MPRIGRGKQANVFYNTGHGHLGWTLSAVTADMVGELVLQGLEQSRRKINFNERVFEGKPNETSIESAAVH